MNKKVSVNKIRKNFGLTESDFDKLLEGLQKGDERMFEHIFLSHFTANVRYLRSSCKLSYENAYDLCMDTMVVFRDKLLSGKIQYGNLDFLFNQMSRQLYLQGLRKKSTRDKALSVALSLLEGNSDDKWRLLETLDLAWESLGDQCRLILQSFYFDKKKLGVIAEQLQKTDSAIRKQKQRCVTQLKLHMKRLMKI